MKVVLVYFFLLRLPVYSMSRFKRDEKCPVFATEQWEAKDRECTDGKRFHCMEDSNGNIAVQGCYKLRFCIQGAHPVLEDKDLFCDKCILGFQPQANRSSNEFEKTECEAHTNECKPEDGQSECRKATPGTDRGCMCNATLGYSLDSSFKNISVCACFSRQDVCPSPACVYTGCLNGFAQNSRGFCEPVIPTTQPSNAVPSSTTVKSENGSTDWNSLSVIIAVVTTLVILIPVTVGVVLCWRRHKLCFEKIQGTQDYSVNILHLDQLTVGGKSVIANIGKVEHSQYGENASLLIVHNEKEAETASSGPARNYSSREVEELSPEPPALAPACMGPSPEQTSVPEQTTPRIPVDSKKISENFQPTPDENQPPEEPSAPSMSLPYEEPSAPPLSIRHEEPSAPPLSIRHEEPSVPPMPRLHEEPSAPLESLPYTSSPSSYLVCEDKDQRDDAEDSSEESEITPLKQQWVKESHPETHETSRILLGESGDMGHEDVTDDKSDSILKKPLRKIEALTVGS